MAKSSVICLLLAGLCFAEAQYAYPWLGRYYASAPLATGPGPVIPAGPFAAPCGAPPCPSPCSCGPPPCIVVPPMPAIPLANPLPLPVPSPLPLPQYQPYPVPVPYQVPVPVPVPTIPVCAVPPCPPPVPICQAPPSYSPFARASYLFGSNKSKKLRKSIKSE
ncbi:hypothetical protein FO519_008161 [Halicephalobus sp. NKZ332]|nr:hypothetical protein FO519_008161 [Halicephalobus sp. NKZ332]